MNPEASTASMPRVDSLANPGVAGPRAAASSTARNAALDFTKGALVLFMVVYHSLNYFHHDKDILKYLRFLPPSFIFITGFLVTSIYRAKHDAGDAGVARRLFVRGFKLLLIFIGLNLIVNTLFTSNYNQRELGLDSLLDNLDVIFVSGEGKGAVFEVLLPISYLLLLAGLLFVGSRRPAIYWQAIGVATIVLCAVLAVRNDAAFNLDLLSMGLLGMAAGFIAMRGIDRCARQLVPLLVAYAGYVTLITFRFPTYGMNIVGVGLTLVLLYGIALRLGDGFAQRRVVTLGRYSLVAYILQIGILQALFRLLRRFDFGEGNLFVALAATALLMMLLIEAVDYFRKRSNPFNRLYQAVFA